LKKQEDIYLSEFRVVKCKKCDAALTEMEGEKLAGCIQCGYSFNLSENKNINENKKPHVISSKIKNSPAYKRYLKKIQNKSFNTSQSNEKINTSPELTRLKNTLKKLTDQENEDKSLPNIKPKKSIVGTIVKWYFIIFISISVLSQCFNR
jgi:hypothetical protein